MQLRGMCFGRLGAGLLALGLGAGCVASTDVEVTRTAPVAAQLRQAQAMVRELARDPESVKFRREAGYKTRFGDQILCGEWDGRNGFGGYSGYSAYYFRYRDGKVMAQYIDSSDGGAVRPAAYACESASRGTVPLPSTQVGAS